MTNGQLYIEKFEKIHVNYNCDITAAVFLLCLKDRVFVFVVNHPLPSGIEYIERFEWMEKTRTLKHLESITDENMDL